MYEELIAKLRVQNRIGTADSYKTILNSSKRFKTGLRFEEVNDVFLYKFENWMLEKGKSITTVGIYLRSLRAVFNEAIYRKLNSSGYYLFSKRRYQTSVKTTAYYLDSFEDDKKKEYSRSLMTFKSVI